MVMDQLVAPRPVTSVRPTTPVSTDNVWSVCVTVAIITTVITQFKYKAAKFSTNIIISPKLELIDATKMIVYVSKACYGN